MYHIYSDDNELLATFEDNELTEAQNYFFELCERGPKRNLFMDKITEETVMKYYAN